MIILQKNYLFVKNKIIFLISCTAPYTSLHIHHSTPLAPFFTSCTAPHCTAPTTNRLQLVLPATNTSHVTLVHITDQDTGHLPQEHHRSSRDHHPQTTHIRDDGICDPLTAHGTNAVTHDLLTTQVINIIKTF